MYPKGKHTKQGKPVKTTKARPDKRNPTIGGVSVNKGKTKGKAKGGLTIPKIKKPSGVAVSHMRPRGQRGR